MAESELGVTLHLVAAATAHMLDRVDVDVFDNPIDPESFRQFLANPMNQLVVAVLEDPSDSARTGTVIGMASAISYVHPDKPLQTFINEVGVAERYRRHGIGTRLIEFLLEHARSLGCTEAWVATEVDNAAARALYRATGGREDTERAVVYTYDLVDVER
ncbi:MAG: GNAT family N-acetyltransferase [Rhodococcus sp.]|nr:GNAT family N-acetyltransferase [Rhodococcus sp. (in: high G+C Gram-positive bacteria)]